MTKRIITAALLMSVLLCIFSIGCNATDMPDLSHSKNVYLYNITADTLLYEKNTDEIIYPGPTVKLMVAAVAIDCLGGDLNRQITVNGDIIDDVYGNNINLQDGEIVTIKQLLNALIVGNANDAALLLAFEAAGSPGAFVVMMNERAQSLGCTNTFYTNATGLHDEGMVTTIEDTAKIAIYLSKYDIFNEIASQEYYIFEETNKSDERKIFNRNYFINTSTEYKYYSPYVTGMNAGYTRQAGYCVVAVSYYQNTQFLSIVMGSEEDDEYIYSFRDAGLMLTWAYTNFTYKTVLDAAQIICEIPVELSNETKSVIVMPRDGLELYLPNDVDLDTDIKLSYKLNVDSLTAPVESDTVVGTITVLYKNKITAQVDLITKSNVPRSELLYLKEMIANAFTPTVIAFVVIFAVIAGTVYIFVNSYFRGKFNEREKYIEKQEK